MSEAASIVGRLVELRRTETNATNQPQLGDQRWLQLENGRVVHRYEWVILVATLALIPVLIIQTEVTGSGWRFVAFVCNWMIWALFLAEIVFVLVVAPRKSAALRAHWVDVALVIVTVPALGAFLSAFRTARLFRLFRLLRLTLLLSRAVQAERSLSRRQIVRAVAILVTFVVIIAGAVEATVDSSEFHSTWDGIWWAIVTVTTVGYGDLSPKSTGGRLIAIVVMAAGVAFLAVLTAAIASHFVGTDADVDKEEVLVTLRRIEEELAELKRLIPPIPLSDNSPD